MSAQRGQQAAPSGQAAPDAESAPSAGDASNAEDAQCAESALFSLRQAGRADMPTFVALVESAYRGDGSRAGWTTEADLLGGQRLDHAMALEMLAEPDSAILLAEEAAAAGPERDLLGCVQIRREGEVAYFGTFAIAPGRQGGGLGSALMAAAEAEAQRRWGVSGMRMTVIDRRADLIAYYERRGWVRTGATSPFPYGDERFGQPKVEGLHFVELSKPLAARGEEPPASDRG